MRTQLVCLALAILVLCQVASGQWVPIGPTLIGQYRFAVSGPDVFVAIPPWGLYHSTNSGTSWSLAGFPDTAVVSLAAIGTNLLAGTTGAANGVFLSTNNGASWTQVNAGIPPNIYVSSFAVSGSSLFAGTAVHGVLLSTDNGTSWTTVNSGIPKVPIDPASYCAVSAFGVSGTNLFANTSGGVFLSTNNGTSWTPANTPGFREMVQSGPNLFANTSDSVFLSTNNGTSWTAVNSDWTRTGISTLAGWGTCLFAGTSSGLFRSTDGGQNWIGPSVGLPKCVVFALSVSGNSILAGTSGGIFVSTDNSSMWTYAKNLFENRVSGNGTVTALEVRNSELFVGCYRPGSKRPTLSDVFYSTDSGDSWVPQMEAWAIAFAWADSLVLAGAKDDGVYRSTNSGTNWTRTNTGLTDSSVYALGVSGTTLFAGTGNAGVFLSTNNGTSWTPANTPFQYFYEMVERGPYLLAGTGVGVYRSTNHGTSWISVNSGLTDSAVASLTVTGTNIFAATPTGGVFLSTNDGSSWVPVNNGLPKYGGDTSRYAFINDIASEGEIVLAWAGHQFRAVSDTDALYLSTDRGTKWQKVEWQGGLTTIALNNKYAFVGTENNEMGGLGWGVWRRPLSEMVTAVDQATTPVPIDFLLEQNYPNPFNPSTLIRYTIAESREYGVGRKEVRLVVYDLLGREVAVLVNEKKAPGMYEVEFDGSGMSSGMYLYRLKAGDYVATKKLLLVR